MKKALKVLLIVFLILIIVAGSVILWQWENIKSITLGVRENSEQIEKRRNENQEKLIEDVNVFMDAPVREITEEEKEQIESGEITISEVYQKIFEEKVEETQENLPEKEDEGKIPESGERNPEKTDEKEPVQVSGKKPIKNEETQTKKPAKKDESQGAKPSDKENPKETKDQIISRYMVELYKLQNEFNSKAESTINKGANYYESIKTHQHDAKARANTITQFTPIVRSIESDCDAKVEKLVQDLESELKSIGADTEVIATIRATYANEKQLKLSYYANKYLK